MKKLIYLVLFKTALIAFTNVSALANEDTENVREGNAIGACPIKFKTSGKCEGEECPYQINLPSMTIQLPKQFRLIEKTLKEVQKLKDEVNNLKKSCQDCKLQADDNNEKDGTEVSTEYSKIQDNRIKELQSKVKKLSASLKNAENQIHLVEGNLEKRNLINMDNVESYVNGKIENMTIFFNSRNVICSSECPVIESRPVVQLIYKDCADHYAAGRSSNGIYRVIPDPKMNSFEVYCDMESMGGGWTVLQMRQDGSTNFNRTWNDYKNGFGNLSREFWLGNDKIHLLTKSKEMQLRIEIEDFNGKREYAKYEQFYVANEYLKYRLSVSGYSGTAGDAMHFNKHYNHDQKFFTTPDKDNDMYPSGNCGAYYSSGWWFDKCLSANLNGKYYQEKYKGIRNGIFWGTWHDFSHDIPNGYKKAFKRVKMMIRPKVFMP
ncbi:fibroleukin [Pelodiscus sinensis]|uniref:Fibrinogen like 2 n=1 Tax=Pelodiscus sinensis TaxID=13735 RepID=K7FN36_PELSI|nr:fibroleukin [Pelodiscus sinensis]|eukprot:XP_006137584.1 fibroleukin [Pelodiscus sinensis]